MVRKIYFFVICFMLAGSASQAQPSDLYMPLELQEAYKANTRSYSGAPGENYFQNTASYEIDAQFDPESGVLKGEETIIYRNNSPDTLNYLVIRVYMNIFQKGVPRDFNVGSADLHDGVTIENLTVNGRKVNSPNGPQLSNDQGTNYMVRLIHPIMPDSKAMISLNWKVELPTEVAIRMGRYGEGNNWLVAYWYPQVSVYDDITGWDTHPFTGAAEFYYDFNDYDVELTLPGDYMVWATGMLQDPSRHYTKNVMEKIEKAQESEEVVSIVTREDISNDAVLKGRKKHTWHFIAEDVPDFAFATSRNYFWDGTSVEVDHQTGRRTFVSAVYDAKSPNFKRVAEIGRETIELFSDEVMGVPFAYPKLTVFNGGGGMEFPMMVNDGEVSDHQGTVNLTAHEIGHNYFPFYVMTNEAYYAFMDEGLITFLPRIAEKKMLEDYDPFPSLIRNYERNAGNIREMPLMVRSYMISDYYAYRIHAYQKPATAFYLLREYLGKEAFSKALKTYIQRWAGKHPTPYDFFFTFEDVLEKDLSWFWNPWFFELGYPDLALSKVEKSGDNIVVNIERKGSLPVPVYLKVKYANGETKVYRESLEVWKQREERIRIKVDKQLGIETIILGNNKIPDVNSGNNTYTVQGE